MLNLESTQVGYEHPVSEKWKNIYQTFEEFRYFQNVLKEQLGLVTVLYIVLYIKLVKHT